MQKPNSFYNRLTNWLWYLLVLVLPFTSVPLISKLTRSSNVAPASGIFLFLLIAIWFIPFIIKKGRTPLQTVPILAFLAFGIFTTALAFYFYSPGYKDNSTTSAVIKALITLIIGVSFYLAASTFLRSQNLIQKTFQLINYSGIAFIAWSILQIAVSVFLKNQISTFRSIQLLISTGGFFIKRASGFALEPSWLAHTLNIIYLPYWLAASVEKTTVHRFKIWKLSLENLLLAGGILSLILTFSRVGWGAFFLMLLYVFIRLNIRFVKWILGRFSRRRKIKRTGKALVVSLTALGLVVIYLAMIVGAGYFASKVDIRMKELFTFSTTLDNPIMRFANTLKFGERVVYWMSGWQIFNDHPILGVGLGKAGFFMPTGIMPYGWSLLEVQRLVYHTSGLLNIKSLWFRLPAETGIVGLVLFITWLYIIYRSARLLQKQPDPRNRMIGLMGIFMLIGLLLEGISIDSFAMPYMWITAGIVTAASLLVTRDLAKKKS